MVQKHVLLGFKEERRYFGRKIIDVKFILKPGYTFIQDMIRANKRHGFEIGRVENYSSDSPLPDDPQK
jgi:hypothetical protein